MYILAFNDNGTALTITETDDVLTTDQLLRSGVTCLKQGGQPVFDGKPFSARLATEAECADYNRGLTAS